jgi:hypothetical protein
MNIILWKRKQNWESTFMALSVLKVKQLRKKEKKLYIKSHFYPVINDSVFLIWSIFIRIRPYKLSKYNQLYCTVNKFVNFVHQKIFFKKGKWNVMYVYCKPKTEHTPYISISYQCLSTETTLLICKFVQLSIGSGPKLPDLDPQNWYQYDYLMSGISWDL